MALRIGITGHRPHKLAPALLPSIAVHLRRVMRSIATRSYPAVPTCVVSLAEGADTLAAETALELGWSLVAPLPFPADAYARDFSGPALDTFHELLARAQSFACSAERDGAGDDDRAYQAASHAMLGLSDGLVAVWNGEPTPLIGGAYDTIGEALRRDLPVLWVHASRDEAPRYLGPQLLSARDITSNLLPESEASFLASLPLR